MLLLKGAAVPSTMWFAICVDSAEAKTASKIRRQDLRPLGKWQRRRPCIVDPGRREAA